jgi:hypothetical protein
MKRILHAACAAAAFACGSTNPTPLEGSASIDALFSVPANGVSCIRLVASGTMRSLQSDFPVAPGQNTVGLEMHAIPTGTVMFSGNAYTESCGSIVASSVPSWMADDVTVNVTPGSPVSVQLNFHANGNATVQGNFIPDVFTVTTLAGKVGQPGSADLTGPSAQFGGPQAVAFDGNNTLYVADRFGPSGSFTGMSIRALNVTTGAVTTLAGNPTAVGTGDGAGSAARFSLLQGIAFAANTLYIADACAIRAMTTTQPFTVSTLLGTRAAGQAWDCSSGPGSIFDIAVHGTDLYVTDPARFLVLKISGTPPIVTAVAGTPGVSGSTDGAPASAQFLGPQAIVFTDATDNFTVADRGTLDGTSFFGLLRRVSNSAVTTLAGSEQMGSMIDGLRTNAFFALPRRMLSDGTSVFVADQNAIRRFDILTGAVVTIAGSIAAGSADGVGAAAGFTAVSGLARNANTKALYVADTGNFTVRVLAP